MMMTVLINLIVSITDYVRLRVARSTIRVSIPEIDCLLRDYDLIDLSLVKSERTPKIIEESIRLYLNDLSQSNVK